MCLLIYKPAGVEIPEEHFRNAMLQNDDGAGFALQLPDKRTLFIDKGCWTLTEFLRRYKGACDYYGGSPGAMIHFRFSTGGKVNVTNCHPFTLTKNPILTGHADLALAHNGVLSTIGACDKYSDTYHLARRVSSFWSHKSIRKELKKHSGPSNKFVLLTPHARHIIGEEHGVWEKGVWYSNNGFRSYFERYRWALADDDLDYSEWDLSNEVCLICEQKGAHYRVGNTDLMVCWDCKKPIDRDYLEIQENREVCSWCEKSVWEHTPHFCEPPKPKVSNPDSILSFPSNRTLPPLGS